MIVRWGESRACAVSRKRKASSRSSSRATLPCLVRVKLPVPLRGHGPKRNHKDKPGDRFRGNDRKSRREAESEADCKKVSPSHMPEGKAGQQEQEHGQRGARAISCFPGAPQKEKRRCDQKPSRPAEELRQRRMAQLPDVKRPAKEIRLLLRGRRPDRQPSKRIAERSSTAKTQDGRFGQGWRFVPRTRETHERRCSKKNERFEE